MAAAPPRKPSLYFDAENVGLVLTPAQVAIKAIHNATSSVDQLLDVLYDCTTLLDDDDPTTVVNTASQDLHRAIEHAHALDAMLLEGRPAAPFAEVLARTTERFDQAMSLITAMQDDADLDAWKTYMRKEFDK